MSNGEILQNTMVAKDRDVVTVYHAVSVYRGTSVYEFSISENGNYEALPKQMLTQFCGLSCAIEGQ